MEKPEKYNALLTDLSTYIVAIITNPKLDWQFFDQKFLEKVYQTKKTVLLLQKKNT